MKGEMDFSLLATSGEKDIVCASNWEETDGVGYEGEFDELMGFLCGTRSVVYDCGNDIGATDRRRIVDVMLDDGTILDVINYTALSWANYEFPELAVKVGMSVIILY
jgi:hypothetical protein